MQKLGLDLHIVNPKRAWIQKIFFSTSVENAGFDLDKCKLLLEKLVDDVKELKDLLSYGTAIYNPYFEKLRSGSHPPHVMEAPAGPRSSHMPSSHLFPAFPISPPSDVENNAENNIPSINEPITSIQTSAPSPKATQAPKPPVPNQPQNLQQVLSSIIINPKAPNEDLAPTNSKASAPTLNYAAYSSQTPLQLRDPGIVHSGRPIVMNGGAESSQNALDAQRLAKAVAKVLTQGDFL